MDSRERFFPGSTFDTEQSRGRPGALHRYGTPRPFTMSIAFARHKLFYLKRPEQLELHLDGLELAGVPEGAESRSGR